MRCRTLAAAFVALLLSACAGTPPRPVTETAPAAELVTPGLDSRYFGPPLPVPPPSSLFTLTAEQEAEFLRYFNAPANAMEAPHWRVFNYLEERLHGFRYYEATRVAGDVLTANEGNCLSLALLTSALARLACRDRLQAYQ